MIAVWNELVERVGGLLCRLSERGGEAGQSMVEYAIMAALIAVAIMGTVQALGLGIGGVFTNILGKIAGLGG